MKNKKDINIEKTETSEVSANKKDKPKKSKTTVMLMVLIPVIFLAGIGLILYPVLGNIIVTFEQYAVNYEYKENLKKLSEEQKQKELEEAEKYNEHLSGGVVEDPFEEEEATKPKEDKNYDDTLGIGENGVMGEIEIPKINVALPIYHGTSEVVLKKGIGHLEGTSLPIGGVSTHSVLTGHSAVPNAKLFTDLEKMKMNDYFYINQLGKTLAYKVCNIKVVLPNNSEDLAIVPEKDLITLLTCTPYGINSHRLLVTGERDLAKEKALEKDKENPEKEIEEIKPAKQAFNIIKDDPILFYGSIIVLVVIIGSIVFFIVNLRKKKKQ